GQSQHPLADGVALDLVGATADAVRQVGEEVEGPPPAVRPAGARQRPRRSEQLEGQFARADDVLADGQLGDRALRPRRLSSQGGGAHAVAEKRQDFAPNVGTGQALADDWIPLETPLPSQLDQRRYRSSRVQVPD